MKRIVLFVLLLVSIDAKYLDSKSCNECHENIYAEHSKSVHHNSSIFKDKLHYIIKQKTSPNKYECALCHTPTANNIRSLVTGEEKPNPHNKQELDGVSCFYCHQITRVLETKHRNINFYAYKENTKPTFIGNIDNYGDSDKHKSSTNEIYKNSQVCMGCHGKKYNKNKIEICNGYNEFSKKSDCIKCHMPKVPGDITKLNKKGRTEYASHQFLGIRSDEMVKKAVKLTLNVEKDILNLTIENLMGHSIIMQPMRLKFVKTVIIRDGKVIWQNFAKSPAEDKKATFMIVFKDKNDKKTFPPFATGYARYNNLKANSSTTIAYDIPKLQKGDSIKSTWISYVLNPKIAQKLSIEDEKYTKKYIGSTAEIVIK